MELVFEDASVFRRFVDGIAVLVDEAEFIIDDKGLGLKATDPSQISLVDFCLPRKAFKKFEAAEAAKIGVDLNYFNQIMSRAKVGDQLELSLSADKSKLSVVFAGAARRSFSIPLLGLNLAELPLPRIDFDSEVRVKADALNDSFKDANLISTHIVLSVKAESFLISAASSKGSLENVYGKKDKSVVSIKSTSDTRAMFPLDYLVSIIKATASDTEVTMRLKNSAPVEITYNIGEGRLQYFLAPRIEND